VVHDARFQTLMQLVLEKADEMQIVSVANALWAMARLGTPDRRGLWTRWRAARRASAPKPSRGTCPR
jgi:hypothetical protein